MTWHLDRPTAEAYVRRSTDRLASASVEAHLTSCTDCQALVAASSDPTLGAILADVWASVDEVLDRPHVGVIERALRTAGCSEVGARTISASARARWSYLAAVAVSVMMAIVAGTSDRDAAFGLFLLLAPIGPLVAAAGAFSRWADPVRPLLRSLPVSAWRIALLRTVASVVPAIALTALAVPLLDDRGWAAVAWLLPSLALSASALALATWVAIEPATLIVGAGWLAAPLLLRTGAHDLVDLMAGQLQIAAVVVVAVATATVAVRRDEFERQVI